jgi:SAM-dependent MidA family methyltransferase
MRIKALENPVDMDKEFWELYNQCKDTTMVTREGAYAAFCAARHIALNKIPGDLVECGVWRGGICKLMALTLRKYGDLSRKIWLYDTFAGMTRPSEHDKRLADDTSAMGKWEKSQQDDHNNWVYASITDVKNNLLDCYPFKQFQFVQGRVEETLNHTIPKNIALLRLDTDFYESTKFELEILYPALSRGGVLLIDDYGHWAGSKKAVDEYFDKKAPLLWRVDYAGRGMIK